MFIEPCCYQTQFNAMLRAIQGEDASQAAHFFSNGDWTLSHLMEYFIGITPACDVFLSLVRVETDTIRAIRRLLEGKDAQGNPLVNTFTLMSQGKDRTQILEQLEPYRRQGRFLMLEDRESFRCLCVGNGTYHYVINGSINQTHVYAMQMFTITTSARAYHSVMQVFNSKKRTKKSEIRNQKSEIR